MSRSPDGPAAEPAPRRDNATWVVVATLAIAWVVYLALFGPRRGGGSLPPPGMGASIDARPADFNWPLKDLDSTPVDLSRYRGRALFLNLWATWCGPCVEELPSIANLAANPRLKGVAFACVTDEDPETVRRFLADSQIKIPVLLSEGPTPPAYRTEGIPATFIISPAGRIIFTEVGSAQWDDPAVVDRLEQLARSAASGRDRP